MPYDSRTGRALDVLVSLADPDQGERVRARIGLDGPPGPVVPDEWTALREFFTVPMPLSGRLWMLEEDEPLRNRLVHLSGGLPAALRLALLNGEPFGPGRGESVPRMTELLVAEEPEGSPALSPQELIPALRAVATMRRGRRIARWIPRDAWQRVIDADDEQPLPGYARWALALRPDCPAVLRERLSGHPSYAHRMRAAGLFDNPGTYAATARPARTALAVLDMGRWAFPRRIPEAEEVLRPLVRGSLGADTEAWAALAQRLPTFTGTVPELITTAGATA
ncbi:hypothetical protein ABT354_00195 [Streptomyces sp. NPDC000594]|uniref:hypothetical protein n=1 Tax=Streptomyces sp. NPDC000594 TaxID=3154261 RepID=UPI00331FDD3F